MWLPSVLPSSLPSGCVVSASGGVVVQMCKVVQYEIMAMLVVVKRTMGVQYMCCTKWGRKAQSPSVGGQEMTEQVVLDLPCYSTKFWPAIVLGSMTVWLWSRSVSTTP